MLSKSTFDPFRLQRCEAGISGGMSLIGTLFSLLAAILISLIGLAYGVLGLELCILAAICAFLGGIFDSFLGSIMQRKNKCAVCGKITERDEHCGAPTERHSGLSFVDNDIVNLLSGIFSAVLAALVCYFVT